MIPAFINPAAGNAKEASDALRAAGAFEIREVEASKLAAAVRDVVDRGAPRVMVAGGDGTLGAAAAALAGTGIELAILPCGTLNHLARDLALPDDLAEAARVGAGARTTTVDGATLNDRLFLNTSSVGAYVTFVRARDRIEKRLGYQLASLVAGARMLVRLPLFRVTLDVDGSTRQYLTPLVFIGVGERELKLPTLGKRVADGRPGLHVMVVRRRSGGRTLALALAAAARGVEAVAQTPAMDAFLVDRCTIEPRTSTVALDGELVKAAAPLEYHHLPACLRVVVGE